MGETNETKEYKGFLNKESPSPGLNFKRKEFEYDPESTGIRGAIGTAMGKVGEWGAGRGLWGSGLQRNRQEDVANKMAYEDLQRSLGRHISGEERRYGRAMGQRQMEIGDWEREMARYGAGHQLSQEGRISAKDILNFGGDVAGGFLSGRGGKK